MLLLEELVREVLAEPVNGSFIVKSNHGPSFILKKNGESPWIKTVGNTTCASVYKVKKSDSDEASPIDIIKALKDPTQKGNIKIPAGTIDKILDEAVVLVSKWFSEKEINFVTTPQSSKTLSIRFAKKISEAIGSKFIAAGTVKDLESAKISEKIPSTFKPSTIRSLQGSLERMKTSKSKDLHSHFRPQDRKYITNWQRLRPEANFEAGTNILIVDDVLSDGATMNEMARALKELGVNIAGCVTLFRTGS